jgi:hypothetical protein
MSDTTIRPETMKTHRGIWYVYVDGEKIRHSAGMRGSWPGHDVACSCRQFETRTGGGTKSYVSEQLWLHRWNAQCDADTAAGR